MNIIELHAAHFRLNDETLNASVEAPLRLTLTYAHLCRPWLNLLSKPLCNDKTVRASICPCSVRLSIDSLM